MSEAKPPPDKSAEELSLCEPTVDVLVDWTGKKPGPSDNCLRRIDNYELIRKLRAGGMGDVFLARHHKFRDRFYAIKLLKPHLVSEEAFSRFDHEINITGKLRHPNLVYAFDAGRVGNESYLVMEFIQGCDLQELLGEKGPLSIANACEIVRQAAEGLQFAFSEAGLTHRDIKPGNLMITVDRSIKVLDLGLARLREQSHLAGLTREGQVLGTPDYMAPEQWNESSKVTATADVYSMGCTLYTLLAGTPPYNSKGNSSLAAKMYAHLSDPVPDIRQRRNDVPIELVALINQSLAKEPGQRFQTPGELATALQPFCSYADLDVYEPAMASLSANSFLPTEKVADHATNTKRNLNRKYANQSEVSSLKRVWGATIVLFLLLAAVLSFAFYSNASKSKPIPQAPATQIGETEVAAIRIGEDLASNYGQINSNTPEGQVVFERERSRLEVLFPDKRYFLVLGITPQPGELRVQSIWPKDDTRVSKARHGFRFGDRSPDQLELDYGAKSDIAIRGEDSRGSWIFSDGPGLHAFLVVSSPNPLPAFCSVAQELREYLQTAWPPIFASPKHWTITNGRAYIHEFDRGTSGMLRGPSDSDGFNMQLIVDRLEQMFPSASIDGLVFNVEPVQ